MEEVWIKWSGPYRLELAYDRDAGYNWGLYSITRIFGVNKTLLYIGQSYRQTVLDRIWRHENDGINSYRGQMKVNFGVIELNEGKHHSKRRTNDIEALMININQPLHNKQHKNGYWGRELFIRNYGRRGLLKDHAEYTYD